MMEILYRTGFYVYDLKAGLSVDGGMIATFTGNREVGLCTHETVPAGLFIQSNMGNPYESSSIFSDSKITLAMLNGGEYQTDIFEPVRYKINDFLYCSCNSKLTNESRYVGNIIIGVVNSFENGKLGFISCFNRGLEFEEKPKVKQLNRFQLLKTTP